MSEDQSPHTNPDRSVEELALWDKLRSTLRARYILFLLCMATILFIGEQSEYDSCIRGQSVRSGLNYASTYFAHSAQRFAIRVTLDKGNSRIQRLDQQSAAAAVKASKHLYVHPLNCSFPFPSTH